MNKFRILFNSQYYGQWVGNDNDGGTTKPRYLMVGSHIEISVEWLVLRTVNQLTADEIELIENVQNWRRGVNFSHSPSSTITLLEHFIDGRLGINYELYRTLISLGVAVPFFYLDDNNQPVTISVPELIKIGWVKIKKD